MTSPYNLAGLLQVSPAEMTGAVTDLLKAAGMPLDLERQQLLQQSLTMQQQLKDIGHELAKQAQVTPFALRHSHHTDRPLCRTVGGLKFLRHAAIKMHFWQLPPKPCLRSTSRLQCRNHGARVSLHPAG